MGNKKGAIYMTNENWFENNGSVNENKSKMLNANEYSYPQYNTDGQAQKEPKKHRMVGLPALIACMLVVALLCSALGAGIMYAIDSNNKAPKTAAAQGSLAIEDGSGTGTDGKTNSNSNTPNGTSPSSGIVTNSTTTGTHSSVQACANTIVGIDVEFTANTMGQASTETGSGSGVLITADGYIVTCNHVVEGASKITVYTDDGTKYEAKLIGSDSQTDLAVLKIEGSNFAHATIGDSDKITLGESVIVIGNPLGVLLNSVSSGIISGLDRDITLEDGQKMSLLQTDASVNPGNSGGGMFNAAGELIGVINAKNLGIEVEGLGFAIPSNLVKTIITELMDQGYVSGRPLWASRCRPLTTAMATRNETTTPSRSALVPHRIMKPECRSCPLHQAARLKEAVCK